MPLFLLLLVVPVIEIALFIQVGGAIGVWPTIGLVLLSAAVGAALLRAQGLSVLGQVQARLRAGEDPGPALAHGALILVAGLMLLTPGFFTDALGLALLVPPLRAAVIRFAGARMAAGGFRAATFRTSGFGVGGFGAGSAPGRGPATGATLEGDYEVIEPAERAPRPDGSGWIRFPKGAPER
jgi:UPF0716 protein FxsA